MAMRTRQATPDDVDAIAEIHVRSWQVAYAGVIPAEVLDNLDVERRREQWAETVTTGLDDHVVFVAETADASLAGFAMAGPYRGEPAAGVGELWAMYTDPDIWGRGAGDALMSAVLGWFAAAAISKAHLWVLSDNGRARRFYERSGWIVASTDPVETTFEIGGAEIPEVRYEIVVATPQ